MSWGELAAAGPIILSMANETWGVVDDYGELVRTYVSVVHSDGWASTGFGTFNAAGEFCLDPKVKLIFRGNALEVEKFLAEAKHG